MLIKSITDLLKQNGYAVIENRRVPLEGDIVHVAFGGVFIENNRLQQIVNVALCVELDGETLNPEIEVAEKASRLGPILYKADSGILTEVGATQVYQPYSDGPIYIATIFRMEEA